MTIYEDYLMLLSPPEAIKHEITRYKKASAKIIGDYPSMNSPAHISIMHLERQKPFMADKNVLLIEQTLAQLPPVLLHWDGFGYFTHLHKKMTIYGNIRSTPAVDAWFSHLKKKLKIKKSITPHITVVRNVPENDFNLLWPHFRHKQLVEPFWINALTVVKRDTFDAYAKWEFFKSFSFKNQAGFIGAENIEAGRIDVADPDQINLF
jgi:2'-5' RNA ligase